MEKRFIFGIAAALIILIGVFALGSFNKVKPDNTDIISFSGTIGIDDGNEDVAMNGDTVFQESPRIYNVEIASSGFSPNSIEINRGDSVAFINKNSEESWPASAVHPTHKAYPNSGIEKCGTGESIFDACRGLKTNEKFTFTFNEVGTWNYHDHLNSDSAGRIIVR
jgi:plastocyanin